MPPRHRRHGLYLARRGFDERQLGHIGRAQHGVWKTSCSFDLGGNDEEHARHRLAEGLVGGLIMVSQCYGSSREICFYTAARKRKEYKTGCRRGLKASPAG